MGKKILLADSSPVVLHDVETALRGSGIEIISTERGDRVMELLRDLRPDLLLADVNLPGKSGYELCALVRQQPQFEALPVVLLTGVYEDFDSTRASGAGATSVISKPFRSEFLAEKLRALLGISAAPTVAPLTPMPATGVEIPWDFGFDGELGGSKSSRPLLEEEPPGKRTESELWSLADLNLDSILEDDRAEPAPQRDDIREEYFSGSDRPTDPLNPPLMSEPETDQVQARAIFDQLEAEPAVEPAGPALTRLESREQRELIARPVREAGGVEESFEELEASAETESWAPRPNGEREPFAPLAAEPVSEGSANLEDEFFEEEYLLEEASRESVGARHAPVELSGPEELAFTESGLELSDDSATRLEAETADLQEESEPSLKEPPVAPRWEPRGGAGDYEPEVTDLEAAPDWIDPGAQEPPSEAPAAVPVPPSPDLFEAPGQAEDDRLFELHPVSELEPEPVDQPGSPAGVEPSAPAAAAAAAGPIDIEQLLRSEEFLDRVAQRVVEQLSERLIENIAWEVVPDIAEREIRAAIAEITKES
ncbi:MAG TPA: response regulator [Acidobacteriota bacterium]